MQVGKFSNSPVLARCNFREFPLEEFFNRQRPSRARKVRAGSRLFHSRRDAGCGHAQELAPVGDDAGGRGRLFSSPLRSRSTIAFARCFWWSVSEASIS